jgi:Phage tail tube protein
MATQPYKGATTAQFYVEELTAGVTPTSPAWKLLRYTGGVPSITRDALVSNELDGSRETSSIRTGNKQVSGEYAIELSARSQDDLLAGAMTSSWQAGLTEASVEITVDPVAKTFTRTAGSFTGDLVGTLVAFPELSEENGKPFIVTSESGLILTGAAIQGSLSAETATTSYVEADKLETGNLCKTFSILTWMKGQCGGADSFLLTRGVEFSGFSIEQAVNAMVTGSFPFIGLNQDIIPSVPSGSTFVTDFDAQPFSSVDVSAFNGTAPLTLIDSFTITNDNAASAQFELGNAEVAFVERGRAANTFSLAGKLYSMALHQQFLNEDQIELTSILSGPDGAMSFTLKRAEFTTSTIEIGGPESITISMEGQATGNSTLSSIVIQRLALA